MDARLNLTAVGMPGPRTAGDEAPVDERMEA